MLVTKMTMTMMAIMTTTATTSEGIQQQDRRWRMVVIKSNSQTSDTSRA
jgi:hypothetical protein